LAYHADHMGMIPADAAPAQRRASLFRESLTDRAERWALGTVYALTPERIAGLPGLGKLWFDELMAPDYALPDPERALANPPGLAGIVHDVSPQTLIAAYRRGLYPWAHVGPLKWWSPPQRCILSFDEFHISRRLRSRLRQDRYRVTFDRDFDGVIKACAGRRPGRRWHLTWITPKVMRAYAALHDAGYAHSFEVWNEAGELAGGGYGVAVGGAYAIESQVSLEPQASKFGFVLLNWHLAKWGFTLSDNKHPSQNVLEMGFRTVARAEYQAKLAQALRKPGKTGHWQVETDLKSVSHWQPEAGAVV
jgi:leucyl/phenylalanyl-tRNA--protein transferase